MVESVLICSFLITCIGWILNFFHLKYLNLFKYLFAFCTPPLVCCLFRFCAKFLIGLLVFELLNFHSSYIFANSLYDMCLLQMFSPSYWLSFHSLNSVFYSAEFLVLMKYNLPIFLSKNCSSGIVSKNCCQIQGYLDSFYIILQGVL